MLDAAAILAIAGTFLIAGAVLSTMALLPAMAGMVLGQRMRKRLSEQLFRKIFFLSLLALGAYLASRALGGLQ